MNYYKTILQKVCFDPILLCKEYRKAIKILKENEKEDLDSWLEDNGLGGIVEPIRIAQSTSQNYLHNAHKPMLQNCP